MTTSIKDLYAQALRLYSRQPDEAEKTFQSILQTKPNHLPSKRLLGRLLFFQKRLDEAIPLLCDVVEKRATDLDSHLFLGIAYVHAHQFLDAERTLFALLEKHPENLKTYSTYSYAVQALHYLGHAYDDAHLDDDAEAAWEKTLECEPGFTKIYKDLSYLFMRIDKPGRARDVLLEGLKHDSNDIHIHLGLIDAYSALGELSNALDAANAARSIAPRDGFIDNNLGEAYLHAKEYARAKDFFLAALELDNSIKFAHYGLGVVHYHLEAFKTSKKYLQKAIDLDSSDHRFHNALAQTLLALGEHNASSEASLKGSQLSSKQARTSHALQGFAHAPNTDLIPRSQT